MKRSKCCCSCERRSTSPTPMVTRRYIVLQRPLASSTPSGCCWTTVPTARYKTYVRQPRSSSMLSSRSSPIAREQHKGLTPAEYSRTRTGSNLILDSADAPPKALIDVTVRVASSATASSVPAEQREHSLLLRASNTVRELTQRIQIVTGIPCERQRLFTTGVLAENETELERELLSLGFCSQSPTPAPAGRSRFQLTVVVADLAADQQAPKQQLTPSSCCTAVSWLEANLIIQRLTDQCQGTPQHPHHHHSSLSSFRADMLLFVRFIVIFV